MKEIFIVMMKMGIDRVYPVNAFPTKGEAIRVIRHYEQIDLEAGIKPRKNNHYYVEKVHFFEEG